MRSSRWFANCSAVLLAACALWASSAAQGQYFLDDFEDGSATDGSPVTWLTVPPYDKGTHVIEQGSYVLTPDGISDYPGTNFSELDLLAEGRSFATVSLRTTVRLLSTSVPPDLMIGIIGRHNSSALGRQAAGVWGAVRSAGRLTLGAFNTQMDRQQTWQGTYGPVSSLLADHDVNLQLDIFADSAALTAWNVGDPRPARPQIFVRDLPSFAPTEGAVGLWTGQSRSISVRPVAYRYFEAAPTPEPSSLVMAVIALAGYSRCRIRLRGRHLSCGADALRGRRMLFVALSASAVVALAEASASAAALRIMSPAGLADEEGNDRGAVTNENRPFYAQYLFPAKDFAALPPGGLTIKSLALRPDGATSGLISASFSDYHLTLSVTSRDSLVATFADNFDEPPTTVYSGAATLSAQTDGPRGGPRPFEYVTLLQQPFHYDPTDGNLLLHVRTSSGWSKPYFADAQSAPANPPANTVVYRVGEANPVTGLTDNYLPVVQFSFVPEPSSLLLGAFLVAGLSLGRRRRVGRLHV